MLILISFIINNGKKQIQYNNNLIKNWLEINIIQND